jgi:hypothetical protein
VAGCAGNVVVAGPGDAGGDVGAAAPYVVGVAGPDGGEVGDADEAGAPKVGGGPYDGEAAVGGTDARPVPGGGVGVPDEVGGSYGFGAVNAHLQRLPKGRSHAESTRDQSRAGNGVRVSPSDMCRSSRLSVRQAGT